MTTLEKTAPPAPDRSRPPQRVSTLHRREHRTAALFVALPVLGFGVFVAYPILFAIVTSFTNWNGITAPVANGVDNYVRMFTDQYFWKSLGNTVFMMLAIPVGLLLSLLLALAMNRKMAGTTFFRTIYYIPVISSIAAIAILWQWAYNGDFGLVNQALGYVGIDGPNWLQNPATAKPRSGRGSGSRCCSIWRRCSPCRASSTRRQHSTARPQSSSSGPSRFRCCGR